MKRLGDFLIGTGLIACFVGLGGYVLALMNGWEGGGSEHWTWNPLRFGLLAVFFGVILLLAARLSAHWDARLGFDDSD